MKNLPLLFLTLGLFVLLSACRLSPWPVGEPAPVPLDELAERDDDDVGGEVADDDDTTPDPDDHDGDGVGFLLDCDDEDPEVYPGAVEVHCDGIDNNCDGESPCDLCGEGLLSFNGILEPGNYAHDGTLNPGSQIDVSDSGLNYYFDLLRIEASATGWIDIVMVGDGIEPYMALLDSNCGLVDSGPVSLTGQSTVMTGTVPGNVLYVYLSSMESMDTGDYDLGISVWGF